MIRLSSERLVFAIILICYLVVGALFALQTPAWQAPDEPAHYNYVAQVAMAGCCPQIEVGDWQQDYQSELTRVKFAPDNLDRLDTIQYEDHQPPLYYLLASLVYKFSKGSLIALRLFSMLLGAVVMGMAYVIGKRVFPDRPQIALAVMLLVGFIPQHMAMLTAVNNDALAELLIALSLYATIRYLQADNIKIWQLALLVGIGLITKTTTYFLVGIVPLAIFLRWRQDGGTWRDLLKMATIFAVITGVFALAWWGRNMTVYGFPDFLGLRAHDKVVVGQLRRVEYIAQHGADTYFREALRITFNSFWGQFGWMAVPLDNVFGGWIYRGFTLLMLVGFSGLLVGRFSRQSDEPINPDNRIPQRNVWIILVWIILVLTLILAVLAFIYYNTEFLQFQGRYLFPGLIPFALIVVYGVDAWRRILFGRWQMSACLTPALIFLLVPLDVYLLLRVIVPTLSF